MPELTWTGKQSLDPVPASLNLDSLVFPSGYPGEVTSPSSRLILGDNLPIMQALLADYENRIDLIYADPPFFTNRKFDARIGRGENSRKPKEWLLAEGYHDHWKSLDDYLNFLYARLSVMYRLLAPTGTLYLHLDWHADAYARLILDEIFGAERLLNVIAWVYHGPSPIKSAFNRKHDTLLVYTKGSGYTFNADAVRVPYDEMTVKTFSSSPKAGFGKIPNLERGKVPEDWWYFPVVARLHNERTGYPTQKPEALLKRIILASSNPGDWVADFFCGSGTTQVVAEQLGRRFIGSDESPRAIHTTRSRLVRLSSSPFSVYTAGTAAFNYTHPRKKLRITVEKGMVTLAGNLDTLEYWEVDPSWDGITFNSRVQATRSAREGNVAPSIKIKTGRRICVRVVTASGSHHQVELDV
jgi:site-specific DNA-methyltransferase (adenine-specific)